mgnify:CR=1 FL=1
MYRIVAAKLRVSNYRAKRPLVETLERVERLFVNAPLVFIVQVRKTHSRKYFGIVRRELWLLKISSSKKRSETSFKTEENNKRGLEQMRV